MARDRKIYKAPRRAKGEGQGRFCTVNLNEEIAGEFKILVKAYTEIYGQRMTPTRVIKRLIDAGVKRCDPEVYEAFIRLTEEGTPEPVLEIIHQVDPTEGEVWNMKYYFEKDGEQIEADWAKSEKASFSVKINNRSCGVKEMQKKGWLLINEVGIEITEEQAMVIAQKRRKHQEDIEFQRASEIFSRYRDDSSLEEDDPIPESKIKLQKDGELKEVWLEEMQDHFDEGWTMFDFSEKK